jgi:pimeloyl-ACP methyl ester carboxylesterase
MAAIFATTGVPTARGAFSRRSLLMGTVAFGAASLSGLPPSDAAVQAQIAPGPAGGGGAGSTYVLVHGAWHGGWCWKRVTPLLRATGADVYAPTLAGLGDRAHRADPDIDLDTHVQDVVNVLEYEDLQDVVLVGHSYGGMVIRGVADRAPQRLARLIYLDAFVPDDGQALLDFVPAEGRAAMIQIAQTRGDGWRVPTRTPQQFGIADEADVRWVGQRLVDQPLKTFTQPVRVTGTGPALPRTYIRCAAGDEGSPYAPFGERLRRDPSWRYRELATGHAAMITAPEALARLLLEPA